jgi:hypothetical protein
MFPVAFVFLGTALLTVLSSPRSIKRFVFALATFVAVSAPFILLISRSKGHFTFGDVGKINYEICIYHEDWFIPATRSVFHPVARLPGLSESYRFATPVPGTYPLWYDPSYWHEGPRSKFNLELQLKALKESLLSLAWMVFNVFIQLNISTALFFLVSICPHPSAVFRRAVSYWAVIGPSIVAIGGFCLIVIFYRHLSAFVGILWTTGFFAIRLSNSRGSRWICWTTAFFLAATTTLLIANSVKAEHTKADDSYQKAALALSASGITSGHKIAVVGLAPFESDGASVARLARLQIVAESVDPERFWALNPSNRTALEDGFRTAGAQFVLVHQNLPPQENGWAQLGNTDYFLLGLAPGTDRN